MVENLILIISSAIIIEELIEVIKNVAVREIHTAAIRAVAILLGIIFAINFDLDLLRIFDLTGRTCVVGIIATGMLIGSGSGMIYDTVERIKHALKEEIKGE